MFGALGLYNFGYCRKSYGKHVNPCKHLKCGPNDHSDKHFTYECQIERTFHSRLAKNSNGNTIADNSK